jgi:phospholipase/carboxylesterase
MSSDSLLYTAHVPGGEGPFPTVILLHGWGANAHDLIGLAPLLHAGRALVLCPQGPVTVPIGGGQQGHGWFQLVPGQPPDPDEFRSNVKRLQDFVALCQARYPIDPRAMAIGGFSQGGTMAYSLALSEPARYSGIMALSTYLPPLLFEELPHLPEQEGLPVLVLHGTADPQIDVERARESREALRSFGVSLTYREFDMGHEIRPEALRVVVRWLEERAFSRSAGAAGLAGAAGPAGGRGAPTAVE